MYRELRRRTKEQRSRRGPRRPSAPSQSRMRRWRVCDRETPSSIACASGENGVPSVWNRAGFYTACTACYWKRARGGMPWLLRGGKSLGQERSSRASDMVHGHHGCCRGAAEASGLSDRRPLGVNISHNGVRCSWHAAKAAAEL